MADKLFHIYDDRAAKCFLTNVFELDKLATGMRWTEGPVWFGDGQYLLWSDVPGNKMYRWTEDGHVSVFRSPSEFANGNTRDRQGRLITCEHLERRVIRTELDGSITQLASEFEGRRLNSPNDIVVTSDGRIWFTDPSYGIMTDYEGKRATPEQGHQGVYCLEPETGRLICVSREYVQPNGLAFSPSEDILYVADSGGSHQKGGPREIFAHSIIDGQVGDRRLFCQVGESVPDGFRLDENGFLWTSAGRGVEVYAPDGPLIGKISVPEPVANLTFGGPNPNRLFITASTSVYAVYTAVRGAPTF